MKQKMIAQAKANAEKFRIGYTSLPPPSQAVMSQIKASSSSSSQRNFIGSTSSMGKSLKDQIKSASLLNMSERSRPGKPSVGMSMLKMTVKVGFFASSSVNITETCLFFALSVLYMHTCIHVRPCVKMAATVIFLVLRTVHSVLHYGIMYILARKVHTYSQRDLACLAHIYTSIQAWIFVVPFIQCACISIRAWTFVLPFLQWTCMQAAMHAHFLEIHSWAFWCVKPDIYRHIRTWKTQSRELYTWYIYTYIYIYIYIYIHTCEQTCIHTYSRTYISIHIVARRSRSAG